MKHWFMVVATLAALAADPLAQAMAGALEDGDAAARGGDYATALRLWRPLAEKGDASAQFKLGMAYDEGLGVPQDPPRAAAWWLKAAGQGDVDAELSLAWMYADGQGVAQDPAESARWFRKLADQGVASAQYRLGWMYDRGRNAPQDYA